MCSVRFGRGGECGTFYSEVWKVDERERNVGERMEEIVDGFEERYVEEKMMLALSEVCRDVRAGRAVEKMWERRFSMFPINHNHAYKCAGIPF